MKKTVAIFLVLALCLCGCSTEEILAKEGIVLPAVPTQMAASNLPTAPQGSASLDDENTGADAPTGETYPWETEFNEAGYTILKEEFGQGKAVTWINGYKKGRSIVYYNNGLIEDSYYYPSGAMSHMRAWHGDGSYSESRWRDDGDVVTMDDGTKISQLGTFFYSKTIYADGSWEETQLYSEGIIEYMIRQFADGSYQEERYYESGQLKYSISQTPNEAQEYRYDEDGYTTYLHAVHTDREIELIADESGKLVKAIENGQTMEDPAVLEQYARDYNFRN